MDNIRNISALIGQQLPDFVRSDYPQFQRFIELYYQWLEDPDGGNTVFHIMQSEKYRDIDETLDPFVRLFKEELLPYFPEKTELDIRKIIKTARTFYTQKGSEESVKWLFRALFDQEVELFYPKKQILKASDGKWKLPQAFRLTLNIDNENIDPNFLEKLKGTGSISTATCVIESANKTIDKNFGTEILEIYVSNVFKEFINGEYLIVQGVTGYTEENPFKEKIIGSLSNIKIDSNINTDPLQKRRGLLYNVGDPIVVFGGLDSTPEARDAVAYVEEVTSGSIEGIKISFPGYGYREYPNTITTVLRTIGVDDPNANLSTSILLSAVTTTNVAGDSQSSFLENISIDLMPIEYLKSTVISLSDYPLFTQNNRNIVINITENQPATLYKDDLVYANGNSLSTANFVGRIVNTTVLTQDVATNILLYSVANNKSLTTTGFLIGTNKLLVPNNGLAINVNSVVSSQVAANANSKIYQTLNYNTLETGGAALFSVINGGYGFRAVPKIDVSTFHDTYWSTAELFGSTITDPDYLATKQFIGNYGKIAHVYIDTGGTGYSNGDSIVVTGRGYGFTGNVVVAGGSIVSTNILDRGEGYYGEKVVSVTSSGGSGAVLSAYGFGEGLESSIETGAIGRIKTIKLTNRGYDYISAPLVSLKVMDIVINELPEIEIPNVQPGNYLYQGEIDNPTFTSIIKSYSSSTKVLRTFNYSGVFDLYSTIKIASAAVGTDGITRLVEYIGLVSINSTATVPIPSQYPVGSVLGNPVFYGNGKAKAIAEFFNGLIKFNGFYLNTDGFLSADKKTQDAKTYHNYSYIIKSEKSLSEYEDIVKNIAHPIGTSMLSRTTTLRELYGSIDSQSDVAISPAIDVSSNVQVLNSYSNIITGNNTTFATDLVGNLISIYDQTYPSRSFIKTVKARNSATNITVEGTFIITGQGSLSTYAANNFDTGVNVNLTGRYVPQVGTVTVSDLNRRVTSSNTLLNGTASVYSINTTVSGVSTDFVNSLFVGDLIKINNEIRVVVTNSTATLLTVNSNFTANSTSKKIYKLSSNLNTLSVNDTIIVNDEERVITSINSPEQLIVASAFSSKSTAIFYKANTDLKTAYAIRSGGTTVTVSGLKMGDIITVNNETRRIIAVPNTTTLQTNAPFKYSASGLDVYAIEDTIFNVSGNTTPINQCVAPGDTLLFNVAAYNEFATLKSVSGAAVLGNTTSGLASISKAGVFNVTGKIAVNDVVSINNQTRSVVSINSSHFTVNTAFTQSCTSNAVLIRIKTINANVISIADRQISTNVDLLISNTTNLVYFIVPNYNSRDYSYSFIKLLD